MKKDREGGLNLRKMLREMLGVSMVMGAVFLLAAGIEILSQFQISTFSSVWLAISIFLMALSGIVHFKG